MHINQIDKTKSMKTVQFFILLVWSTILGAQEKSVFTHEDMWNLKRVSAPKISPDGKWVIFGLTEPSYDEKEQFQDIYVCATDGSSSPRKLTGGKGSESAYSWSPDGNWIAFTAKRDADEKSQIYLLPFTKPGEAFRLTNLSTGASNPQWSPDSKQILFSSTVYPQCFADSCNKKKMEEEKKLKFKARIYEQFPIRSWDHWLDNKQTHFFIQSLSPTDTAYDVLFKTALGNTENVSIEEAEWSPDQQSILLTTSLDVNETAYKENSNHIYKINLKDSTSTVLTKGNFDYGQLSFSKNGKILYCQRATNNTQDVYALPKLIQFDYPEMTNERLIFNELDRPIHAAKMIDEERIYFNVENEGRDQLLQYNIKTKEVEIWNKNRSGCFTNMDVSENNDAVVVANYESMNHPPEIVRIVSKDSVLKLTNFNTAKLSTVDFGSVETFWNKNKKGRNIRSMLIKPSKFDPNKKYPLLTLMHGGPAGSWKENWSYRWNYHLLAKNEYLILLTDFTGSTGYGEQFSKEIKLDPFKGPGEEILEAAQQAIKKFSYIDATRQAAAGASYGGHLANWMQATTKHFKCLISHAGLVNSVSQWGTSDVVIGREFMNGSVPWANSPVWKEQNPFNYSARFQTPMLITVGEQDFRVPLNNSIENFTIHQRLKIPSKLIVFPEENHWILKAENSRFFYNEVHGWLKKYL